jgi:SAM-dependent methyltransferase
MMPVPQGCWKSFVVDDLMFSFLKKFNASPESMALSHFETFRISELLPADGKNKKLVLLGCGDAGERALLEQRGFEVCTVDIREMPGVDIVASACALPFPGETIDVVLSMQVLEHIDRPWEAVKEVGRVLKPGGCFLGSVAFLKPFHDSYFHMTHLGLELLFRDAGLEAYTFFGAQSVLASIGGNFFGINASSKVGKLLTSLEDRFFSARRWAWRTKNGASFGDAEVFRQDDRLRFGAAIVFKAVKLE